MLAEYESNIRSLTKSIGAALSELEDFSSAGEEADAMVDKLSADIRSARAELTKFKSYTAGLDRADKDMAVAQYGNLEKLVSTLQRRLNAVENKLNHDSLAGGAGKKYRDQVDEQNRMLERSNDRLHSVKVSLAESEEHAMTITDELGRNRKTILGAKQKVGDTQMELKGAGRILNRMFVRNVAQRASIFVMLIIGGAIVLIVLIACLTTPGVNDNTGVGTTIAPLK